MNLATARNMLPLVRSIVADIVYSHAHTAKLRQEQAYLDKYRRELVWPERARRYAVQEELSETEANFTKSKAELDSLGLSLIDPAEGHVGFPTRISGKPAYYSWKQGENDISYWSFSDDGQRRPLSNPQLVNC